MTANRKAAMLLGGAGLAAFGLSPLFAQELEPASSGARYVLDTAAQALAAFSAFAFVFAYGLRDVGLAKPGGAAAACLRTLAGLAISILAFWLVGFELMSSVEAAGLLGDFAAWAPAPFETAGEAVETGVVWLFHTGLAAMTVAVAAAAIAERAKLWPFLIFAAALAALIYPITSSWIRFGGYLAEARGFVDEAGASLHIVAGAAGLAGAIVVGPRPGRYARETPWDPATATLPLAIFAAGIAWIAWQGVALGYYGAFSTVEDMVRFGRIEANFAVASAGAALCALALTQLIYRRVGLVTSMCAVIAGLVSISADPAAPDLWQAAMIGAVGGVIVTVAPPFLNRYEIDDAGFVVPAHLICGVWSVLIAAWTNAEAAIASQLLGAGFVAGFSFLVSLFVWIALKYSLGVRLRAAAAAEPARGAAALGLNG